MSIEFNSNIESYLSGFEQFSKDDHFNEIGEITELRKNAIENFKELGFPTLRDEDWRFTNLTPISKGKFKLNGEGSSVDASMLESFTFKGLDTYLLVFVNGKFSKELSNIQDVPDGVTISSLSDAKTTDCW